MINVDAFRRKRKQLLAQIAHRKRKLRLAKGDEALRLRKAIVADEEQAMLLKVMINDKLAMICDLYEIECYGPPQ